MIHLRIMLAVALMGTVLCACAEDPRYLYTRDLIEVGIPDSDINVATAQVILPVRLETEDEALERAELVDELGGVDVPYVGLADLSVSIEWTIRNLSATDGIARIHVNGGNEWFSYVPDNFVIDPEEDEEPPPLAGDIPMVIPASATVSGVFREDQLAEAALDLELITRGGTNPFAAILQRHAGLELVADPDGGVAVPRQAFAQMVQYDVSLRANRHMVLEFVVRVRDHRGLLHDMLLDAPDDERTAFAPMEFVPAAP